jgi:hypothetical protein
MRLIHLLPLALPAAFGLAACEIQSTPPAEVVVQPAPTTVVPAVPTPPPPPEAEVVPPPPPTAAPSVWQPGHWRYTGISGNPWSWVPGRYVVVPPGATAWVPGQWQQQGNGWVWREGHWT